MFLRIEDLLHFYLMLCWGCVWLCCVYCCCINCMCTQVLRHLLSVTVSLKKQKCTTAYCSSEWTTGDMSRQNFQKRLVSLLPCFFFHAWEKVNTNYAGFSGTTWVGVPLYVSVFVCITIDLYVLANAMRPLQGHAFFPFVHCGCRNEPASASSHLKNLTIESYCFRKWD